MRIRPKETSSPALQEVREEAKAITKAERRALKPLTNFVAQQHAAALAMRQKTITPRKPNAKTTKAFTRAAQGMKEFSTSARRQWSSQGRRG